MRRYVIRYLPQAHENLLKNAKWWAENHSRQEASRWLASTRSQINTLRTLPHRHGLSAENARFPIVIRDKLLGSRAKKTHRAVFTIREEDGVVLILAVLHVSQGELKLEDLLG